MGPSVGINYMKKERKYDKNIILFLTALNSITLYESYVKGFLVFISFCRIKYKHWRTERPLLEQA